MLTVLNMRYMKLYLVWMLIKPLGLMDLMCISLRSAGILLVMK